MKKKKKVRYSDKKLKQFKHLIQTKLKRTKSELGTLSMVRRDHKEYISQNEMGFSDDSRRYQQRAVMGSMITRMKKKRRKLQDALVRIENKTYGICIKTGDLISEQRLVAVPTARKSAKFLKKKK